MGASANSTLAQCLILSALLHLLLVLIFGTAERGGGGRAGGTRLPSSMTVTLAPGAVEVFVRPVPDRQEAPVRPPGRAAATPEARRSARDVPSPVPPSPKAAPAPSAPRDAPTAESLPRLDPGAPEMVDKAVAPAPVESPAREATTETVPRVEIEAPRDVAPAAQQPVAPAARPAREREAPPIAPAPATIVETPPELPKLERVAPVEPVPEPKPSAPPSVDLAPAESPPAPPAPPVRVVPQPRPRAAPEPVTPSAPPAPPPATPPPVAEPPPRATLEPELQAVPEPPLREMPKAPPVVAPPAAPAVEREVPRPVETTPAPMPAPRPVPGTERATPRAEEAATPRLAPAPSPEAPPRIKFGTPPTPEEEVFKPRKPGSEVETVMPIGKAPRLELEASRKPGPVAGRSDTRKGVLNLFPPPPEKESKLARDIQRAAQPDCRDAYAALGLLAVPLLLKDAVTDTGCRW